jgi:hypothetical protein
MNFKATIVSINAKVDAQGDTVQRVTLDIFGDDFNKIHSLLKKPLDLEINEELTHD